MRKGKRGQHSNLELWFLVGAFLIAAVAGLSLFGNASQSLEGTLLEKNFIARDLAMTIEAVYASPGDIDFIYYLGNYRYKIDMEAGKVVVSDWNAAGKEGRVSYRIIGVPASGSEYVSYDNPEGLKVKMPDFVMVKVADVKDCNEPVSLVLSKRFNEDGSSEISVSGKNAVVCNKLDDACTGSVMKCE